MRQRLNLAEDVRSLTDFKRHTTDLLRQVHETGRPLVLTVNGRAEVVVQDAAAYQALLDRVEAVEALRFGLEQSRTGQTVDAVQALREIESRYEIPPDR